MKLFSRVKFSLVVVFVLFAISSITYAQPPGGGGGRQGGPQGQSQAGPKMPSDKEITNMVSKLSEELSLSSDQEENILDLYIAHFDALEEKMKSGRPEKSEMDAFKLEFEDKVKLFLDDEQIGLYETYLKENKKQEGSQQGQRK